MMSFASKFYRFLQKSPHEKVAATLTQIIHDGAAKMDETLSRRPKGRLALSGKVRRCDLARRSAAAHVPETCPSDLLHRHAPVAFHKSRQSVDRGNAQGGLCQGDDGIDRPDTRR